LSEITVEFHGEGAGTAELTWGQWAIWKTIQHTNRTMNMVPTMRLPDGTPLTELVEMLRFMVSRHPALRTRMRFVDGPSGHRHPQQFTVAQGEVPLQIIDIDDEDDPDAALEELRLRYEFTWFDWENEFPVRMGLIRQAGALVHLAVGYHHVMVDGIGLLVLGRDTDNLDKQTWEATAPPPELTPLEVARVQGSADGRRQGGRALQHWAAQLDRLNAWSPGEPASMQEPRYWELVARSPALEAGIRAVAARTRCRTADVLMAAYSVAVARVFGRNPSAAQIIVSNRFRPGFADLVSQISQSGICVIDSADATFDEVVERAQKAVTAASFNGYYNPLENDRLLDETAARLGRPLDISWFLNDRRSMMSPEAEGGEAPTEAELMDALSRTRMFWDRKVPDFDGTLYLQVDSEPVLTAPSREVLREPGPAVYLEVWADTHHFAIGQVEAFVREMENVVVASAFDGSVVALPGSAGLTGHPEEAHIAAR
jgi:hypothetical protein